MKQNIVVVLLAFMLIFSTAAKQGKYYTISGVWSGADGEMVYLQRTDGKTKQAIKFDSAKVVEGKFVIEGKKSLSIDEYELSTAYGKSNFVLSENPILATITTAVTMGKKGEVKRATIVFSGDVEQKLYAEINKAKMTGMVGVMGVAFMLPKAQEEGNKKLEDSLLQMYVSSQAEQKRIQDSLMDNFTDSYAVALLVREISSKSEPFDKFEQRYNALSQRVKKSSIGLELKKMVAEIGKAAVGKIAPDFKAATPEGESLSLSSLKGKYVLIDFWASWCAPCLAEVPNVKAVYDEYHPKGLEILSVSLDEDKAKWMAAITKHNLNWKHISTLKGWDCGIAKTYNVSGVPAMILLDKDGRIVTKDLRGEKLREEISKLIDKK